MPLPSAVRNHHNPVSGKIPALPCLPGISTILGQGEEGLGVDKLEEQAVGKRKLWRNMISLKQARRKA